VKVSINMKTFLIKSRFYIVYYKLPNIYNLPSNCYISQTATYPFNNMGNNKSRREASCWFWLKLF